MIPEKIRLGLDNLESIVYGHEKAVIKNLGFTIGYTDISSLSFSSERVHVVLLHESGKHVASSFSYEEVFGFLKEDELNNITF